MSDQRLTILHGIDAEINHCNDQLFEIQNELNGLSAPNQDSHYGRVISDTYGRLMQERKSLIKEIKKFEKTKEFFKTINVGHQKWQWNYEKKMAHKRSKNQPKTQNGIKKTQNEYKGYDQQNEYNNNDNDTYKTTTGYDDDDDDD
eukprot:1014607_1